MPGVRDGFSPLSDREQLTDSDQLNRFVWILFNDRFSGAIRKHIARVGGPHPQNVELTTKMGPAPSPQWLIATAMTIPLRCRMIRYSPCRLLQPAAAPVTLRAVSTC
jgi:hypothetical protein